MNGLGNSRPLGAWTIVLVSLIICTAIMAAPAMAATKYLGGEPSFSAAISGVNEFVPGEEGTISILVKNSGLFQAKQLDKGTIEPEDLPNTAKTVKIGLASGTDAIIIKTDPQMVGDIQGNGGSVTVQFDAKISTNATTGEYQLPLTIQYLYPRVMNQEAADVYEFTYNERTDTLPVTIRIKPQVKIEILNAVPDNLTPGSDGYVNLTIRNIGPENGEKAVLRLVRNGKSPIIPVDSSVYIGSLPSGGIAECRYKVSVSKDASNQTYPLDAEVFYTDREGSAVTSQPATTGIAVNAKPVFTIVSPVPDVSLGSSRTIDVQYRNDGSVTVYSAQARITSHDTVTFPDGEAFIGDIGPGETVSAQYRIEADDTAPAGTSSFSSTIRYRDASGVSQESDVIPVQISVVSSSSGTPGWMLVLGVVIIAGIAVLALAYMVRQRKNRTQ